MSARVSGAILIAGADDAEQLALLSHSAKRTYEEWGPPGWKPPSLAAERERWIRRLQDDAGWTAAARAFDADVGTVHFTGARTERGAGETITGRAHLSGLFVRPESWSAGVGSTLLGAAIDELQKQGYREAQLCTAVDNRRSRTFYEDRGWRPTNAPPHEHDHLSLVTYIHSLQGRDIGA